MDHFFQLLISVLSTTTCSKLDDTGLSRRAHLAHSTGHTCHGNHLSPSGRLDQMATTLDVLSQGRAYFGIGASWFEEEHRGLGIPFPARRVRFELLEETLRLALQMWSGDDSPL